MKTPLNRKRLCEVYGFGETKRDQLVKGFLKQARPEEFIKDGKVLVIEKEAFERWWKSQT